MKVTYKENLLTVVTDLSVSAIKSGISDLKARDEKGNEVFAVSKKVGAGAAHMSTNQFVGNYEVDGKLAAQFLEADGTTEEQVQKKYGEALLAVALYTSKIAVSAAEKEADIKALFTEETAAQ